MGYIVCDFYFVMCFCGFICCLIGNYSMGKFWLVVFKKIFLQIIWFFLLQIKSEASLLNTASNSKINYGLFTGSLTRFAFTSGTTFDLTSMYYSIEWYIDSTNFIIHICGTRYYYRCISLIVYWYKSLFNFYCIRI